MSENGKELTSIGSDTIMKLVGGGDTAGLTPAQKLDYYKARCEAAGLDNRTAPFQFIRLQGREVLYATKGATDQLASNHGIRVEIQSQATENGVRTVVVRAVAKDGRQTDDIGVVPVDGLKGADMANAYMKAVTKAKRRAILSLCGLGMLDESELDTIKDAGHTPTDNPPVSPTTPPPAASNTRDFITLPQAKRFFAIAKSAGKTDDEIRSYLNDTLGIDKSAQITRDSYENAISWAQTVKTERVNEDTGEVN
jgi:hypothetical protein